MTSNVRRLAIIGVLAVLFTLVPLGAAQRTPAQSPATETAVPPAVDTAVPPTETPTPADTAVPQADTPTTAPANTAVPTEIPAQTATSTPEPPKQPSTISAPSLPTPTAPPISSANHAATISPTRTTVNNWVTYTLVNFPPNATVHIVWKRNSGSVFEFATTTTDALGAASGRFRVPAVTGGPNQTIAFFAGAVTKRVTIEVRPRIKVLTNPAVCDQPANVSLRGYAKNELVRIRWKIGTSWVQLATVVTSNTGSANIFVTVPSSAPAGFNSVRGDGTIFRQQTNAAFVECEPTT
jgi:hypothetical protein